MLEGREGDEGREVLEGDEGHGVLDCREGDEGREVLEGDEDRGVRVGRGVLDGREEDEADEDVEVASRTREAVRRSIGREGLLRHQGPQGASPDARRYDGTPRN